MRTIDDVMADPDRNPREVIVHDGMHDHQTCAKCRRSWGAGCNDYSQSSDYWSNAAREGQECPDPECRGPVGMYASAHFLFDSAIEMSWGSVRVALETVNNMDCAEWIDTPADSVNDTDEVCVWSNGRVETSSGSLLWEADDVGRKVFVSFWRDNG